MGRADVVVIGTPPLQKGGVAVTPDEDKEALAPVERGALLAGSGPEAWRLLTADRKAEPIRS